MLSSSQQPTLEKPREELQTEENLTELEEVKIEDFKDDDDEDRDDVIAVVEYVDKDEFDQQDFDINEEGKLLENGKSSLIQEMVVSIKSSILDNKQKQISSQKLPL